MNILIVHNYYKIPGGEDAVVQNEVDLLRENGHNVFTYFKYNDKLDTKGIKKIGVFRRTVFNKKIKKEIKQLIRLNNIEVVHCHNTFPMISPSVYKYAKQEGCKVFQTIHNFRFLCANAEFVKNGSVCEECLDNGIKCALKDRCYHNSFLQTLTWVLLQKRFRKRKYYNYVDKFICLTEFNKQKLANVIPKDKICIKPNGSKFVPDNSPATKTQFIYVGRVEEIKGMQTLIEAFGKPGMPKLNICGTGKDLEKFKKTAEGFSNIKFSGFLNSEELKAEWKKSYALIIPSKWYEGFPMIIPESLSLGIPVIANDIGNLPFIVENNVNGLIFDRNSVEDLTSKALSLTSDGALLTKLSENAFKSFEDNYTNEQNYRRLIEIYTG